MNRRGPVGESMAGQNRPFRQQSPIGRLRKGYRPKTLAIDFSAGGIHPIERSESAGQIGGVSIKEIHECSPFSKKGLIDEAGQFPRHGAADLRSQLRVEFHVLGNGGKLLYLQPLLRKMFQSLLKQFRQKLVEVLESPYSI